MKLFSKTVFSNVKRFGNYYLVLLFMDLDYWACFDIFDIDYRRGKPFLIFEEQLKIFYDFRMIFI